MTPAQIAARSAAAVPEPSSTAAMAFVGVALAGGWIARRRRA